MSNEPGQRQLTDLAMGILRQAGSDLPRMVDEPLVSWAILALASTVPAPEADTDGVIVPLPVSFLNRFRTVDYGSVNLQEAI